MSLWPVVVAMFCVLTASPPRFASAAEDADSVSARQPSLADRYRQALAIDPGNLPLHYYLGVALLAEDKDREAIAEFSRAYSAFADSIEMNYNLGLAYARIGDPDSALLYFDQAEFLGALDSPELYPLADAYYNLALSYLEAEDVDETVRLFAKTLALDPDRHEIHRLLGDLYARHGQPERALEAFDTYLKAYPGDAATREYVYTLHFNRAQQRLENEDIEGARAAFDEALGAAPGSPLAIYYLGYLDYTQGDLETAATRLTTVYADVSAEVRQSIDTILYNCALTLLEQRRLRQALAAIEPLVAQRTPAPKSLYLAGNIHLALKEFVQARASYNAVLELDPSHRGAAMNLVAAAAGTLDELFEQGRTLFRQGEYRAALQKLEAALAINPAEPRARAYAEEARKELVQRAADLFERAEQALRRNEPGTALSRARDGLNLMPGSARGTALQQQALEELARILSEALETALHQESEGLLEDADRSFSRALAIDPDNAEAREGRARITQLRNERATAAAARGTQALESGRLSEAREAFAEALELTPGLGSAVEGLARAEALTAAMIEEELQWGRRARSAGQLTVAREHFAKALRLSDTPAIREELDTADRAISDKIATLLEAAGSALEEDDFNRARIFFAQVRALAPGHPDAARGLSEADARAATVIGRKLAEAAANLEASNFRRALAGYREVLDISPTNADALDGLKRGRKSLQGELDRLVASGNENLEKGLFQKAAALFQQALALDPFQPDAQAAMERLERLKDAGVKPGDERRLYLQGIELYTQGRYEDAVTAWERLLVLSPGHEKALMNIEKARRKLRQIREYHDG